MPIYRTKTRLLNRPFTEASPLLLSPNPSSSLTSSLSPLSFPEAASPAMSSSIGFLLHHDTDQTEQNLPHLFWDHSYIPREMPAAARSFSYHRFMSTYSPPGRFHLGTAQVKKLGPGWNHYHATVFVDGLPQAQTATANEPVQAVTGVLSACGCNLEVRTFRQRTIGDYVATFTECLDKGLTVWSVGLGLDATTATMRALIAGAN